MSAAAYFLTVKFLALPAPPTVVTTTLTRSNVAFFGTLHLMVVGLQDAQTVHFLAPLNRR